MSSLVIDTHAAIWYFAKSPRMSVAARAEVNDAIAQGDRILLPSISIVEIVYLIEKKRLIPQTLASLMQKLKLPDNTFAVQDLTADISQTLAEIPRSIVPDMPDRIIAATALHLGLPLVTSDRNISNLTNISTVW